MRTVVARRDASHVVRAHAERYKLGDPANRGVAKVWHASGGGRLVAYGRREVRRAGGRVVGLSALGLLRGLSLVHVGELVGLLRRSSLRLSAPGHLHAESRRHGHAHVGRPCRRGVRVGVRRRRRREQEVHGVVLVQEVGADGGEEDLAREELLVVALSGGARQLGRVARHHVVHLGRPTLSPATDHPRHDARGHTLVPCWGAGAGGVGLLRYGTARLLGGRWGHTTHGHGPETGGRVGHGGCHRVLWGREGLCR
mmetsp:Transcript_16932/g.40289  ORF Transcript_16932/g.40289 Transcript_16932/m.40289 type:complete len:255 (-) Transcript_16932:199-963(-)